MDSYDYGKPEVVAWVKKNFPKGATCLDVGAGSGKWADLLGDYLKMDACEIFEPFIEQYELRKKYTRVYCCNIADYQYEWYDLIIFGDVIEHMDVLSAQIELSYAYPRCKDMIIGVPFLYPQDEVFGNKYEKHIQDDLTDALFHERYKGFKLLIRPIEKYAYYIKNENYSG